MFVMDENNPFYESLTLFAVVWLFGLAFFILTVVYIVTFSRSKSCLEVCQAVLNEDVIPLQELFDIAIMDAVAVVFR